MPSGGINTADLKQTNIGIMIVAIKVYTQIIVQSPEYGSSCTGMPHQSVNAVQMITTVNVPGWPCQNGPLEPTGSGHVLEDRDTILGH